MMGCDFTAVTKLKMIDPLVMPHSPLGLRTIAVKQFVQLHMSDLGRPTANAFFYFT